METPPIGVEKHERKNSILADLTTRMTQVLNHNQTRNQITNHEPTHIGIKLDGTNYALWSQIVEMYISSSTAFANRSCIRKWRTENACLCTSSREDLRQSVMMMNEDTISVVLYFQEKDINLNTNYLFKRHQMENLTRPQNQSHKGRRKCTHCGNTKHTKETCFKLHGYPDWWHELKEKKSVKQVETTIRLCSSYERELQLSLVPQQESSISTGEQIAQNDSGNQGYELNCCALMYPNFFVSGYSHQGDYWLWY
ncbi:hypothetical protein AAG906_020146 [Vitis piasezkii]